MSMKPQCAHCTRVVCNTQEFAQGPPNCPTVTRADVIKKAVAEYDDPGLREFARQASVQEFECYLDLPAGRTTVIPRVEEVAQFARKMGYQKLGIAFCGGLREEAKTLSKILENRGFSVVSVSCKAGAVPKERIGIMCSPTQRKKGVPGRRRMVP